MIMPLRISRDDYIGKREASDNAIPRHLREARERVCPHLPFTVSANVAMYRTRV